MLLEKVAYLRSQAKKRDLKVLSHSIGVDFYRILACDVLWEGTFDGDVLMLSDPAWTDTRATFTSDTTALCRVLHGQG